MKRITNNEEEIYYPNRYSTTEKKIGTWIDGKPIYRRVINLTQNLSLKSDTLTVGNAIPSGISFAEVKNIINAFMLRDNPNYAYIPVTLMKNSDIQLKYYALDQFNNLNVLVFEYTKNTD